MQHEQMEIKIERDKLQGTANSRDLKKEENFSPYTYGDPKFCVIILWYKITVDKYNK